MAERSRDAAWDAITIDNFHRSDGVPNTAWSFRERIDDCDIAGCYPAGYSGPRRFAIEPRIDAVPGLVVFRRDQMIEPRNRSGQIRDWQRHPPPRRPAA